MKDNRPNYRITIRPEGIYTPTMWYGFGKWGALQMFTDKHDIYLDTPINCIGIKGYHPDSSKLKKV